MFVTGSTETRSAASVSRSSTVMAVNPERGLFPPFRERMWVTPLRWACQPSARAVWRRGAGHFGRKGAGNASTRARKTAGPSQLTACAMLRRCRPRAATRQRAPGGPSPEGGPAHEAKARRKTGAWRPHGAQQSGPVAAGPSGRRYPRPSSRRGAVAGIRVVASLDRPPRRAARGGARQRAMLRQFPARSRTVCCLTLTTSVSSIVGLARRPRSEDGRTSRGVAMLQGPGWPGMVVRLPFLLLSPMRALPRASRQSHGPMREQRRAGAEAPRRLARARPAASPRLRDDQPRTDRGGPCRDGSAARRSGASAPACRQGG